MLIVLGWTSITRVMRGSVIATKQRDYVDAARAMGAGDFFIIRKHILANSIAPVIVLATIGLGAYIGAEATLTFLGVGYQRPTVSWGLLVNEGQTLALAGASGTCSSTRARSSSSPCSRSSCWVTCCVTPSTPEAAED